MNYCYTTLLLHAHLPYVRHRQADRLEERWLFEAITETYIPLLWQLEKEDHCQKWTISFSPPLMEMLADSLMQRRYLNYLQNTESLLKKEIEHVSSHKERDIVTFYMNRYKRIKDTFMKWNQNILQGYLHYCNLGKIECITSAATHAFLPYIMTEQAVMLQIHQGISCFEKHFGFKPKGFWLPECGFTPGVDRLLFEAGIRYTVVDEHSVTNADPVPDNGNGAPIFSPHGVALFPRNQMISNKVWSSVKGYPGDYDYREFYRDIAYERDWDYIKPHVHPEGIRVESGLKYNRITGSVEEKDLYVRDRAEKKVKQHAVDFQYTLSEQLEQKGQQSFPPYLMTLPFDAELFGHWWFEGPEWLHEVIKCRHEQIEWITPSEYLKRHYKDLQTSHVSFSTWGRNGFGEVWMNEKNEWIYRHHHELEKKLIKAGADFESPTNIQKQAIEQLVREWMLAVSSDWAFIMDNETASNYAVNRFKEHVARFLDLFEKLYANNLSQQLLTEMKADYPFLERTEMNLSLLKTPHDTYLQEKSKKIMKQKEGLRILMFSWEFPPMVVGGLARHVADLAKEMVRQGNEVYVLTTYVEGYPEYELNEGIHVYRVKGLQPNNPDFFHWVGGLNLALADQALALAKKIEFDVIHAHDWLVSVASKATKLSLNIPLIATIHATEHGRNDGIHTGVQSEIHQKEWELTFEADHVIVCSHYMRDEVMKVFALPNDKISILPNGVDPEMVKPSKTERTNLLDKAKVTVFSVGRIVREKGFETIIDAAPSVIEKHSNVQFVIAGKGPMLEEYRQIVKERGLEYCVKFVGFISDEERNALLNFSDAALFPSLYEPFGIVALESMIAGIPTIVSDTGGLGSIVEHGKTGLKMYPGDAASLALQVNQVLDDKNLAKELSAQGKYSAECDFSWKKISHDTTKLFHVSIENKKKSGGIQV